MLAPGNITCRKAGACYRWGERVSRTLGRFAPRNNPPLPDSHPDSPRYARMTPNPTPGSALRRQRLPQPARHPLDHRILPPAIEVVAVGNDIHLDDAGGPVAERL